MPDDSQALFARYRAGSDGAADEIVHRYFQRLTALARARLTEDVAGRVDPEDAVQSALRSFFIGAREDRFELVRRGDLWRLLAAITSHKASRLTTHHRAARRSVRRQAAFPASASFGIDQALVDPQHSPAEVALRDDELAELLRTLSSELRQVLALRLQDLTLEEIAAQIGCSTRTIRRRLNELGAILERRAKQADDADSPPPASTIDYRDVLIEAHLGSGGMGRVYRARRRSTGEVVALKVLRRMFHRRAFAVERFRNEAAIVASLDHPGIVRTHGFGTMPAGSEFFVMDFIAGGDLTTVARATFDDRRSTAWLAEAATAVAYANERGIVHCDLKPSNLLLDAAGRIVVSDFGLATAVSSEACPAGATLAFAAPELLCPSLGPVSAATDVWGLGALLAWLLWETTPWHTTTVAELTARIQSGREPDLPNEEEPSTRRAALAGLCRRCLQINPSGRYGNCRDVAVEMHSLIGRE